MGQGLSKSKTLRVLNLEDSRLDAELIQANLLESGFDCEVTLVQTRADFADALEKNSFDLILSDYTLPSFDGLSALKMTRENHPEVPFILVSGALGEELAIESIKSGATDYVLKHRLERLVPAVRRAVHEAEERSERRRVEEALQRSEERFRALVQNTSDIIMVLDAEGTITYESPAVESVMGYRPEERIGTCAFDHLHPDDHGPVRESFAELLENPDERLSAEYRVRDKEGFWHCFEAIGVNLLHEPSIEGVVVNARDITERKKAEGRIQFLADLNQALQPLIDPHEVMATAARLLGEHLGADRCAYAEVEVDEDHFLITGDYTNGVPSIVGRFAMSQFGSEALRLMRVGEPYVVADAEADERVGTADLAAYRQTQIRAVVSVPLHKAGRFVAGMAVHQKAPRRWSREEIELVKTVSDRCWESIERARAEEARRQSEERFRATFEQAAVGVGHVALDGRWLRVNGKLCEIIGYSREELLGLTFQQITHPDDLEADLGHLQRLLAGEIETYSIEKRYFRKDGSIVWIYLTVSLTHEPSGEPGYFISVIQDIGEHKRAEEALYQSEALYRMVVEQAAEPIYLVDVETKRILEFNPTLHRSLGYTIEELRELTLYDILDHDQESVNRNIRHIMKEGRTFLGERKYRRKDGSIMDVEVSVSTTAYDGKEVMCIVAHDITERKRAEDMLRRSLDSLLALYEAGQVLGSTLEAEEVGSRLLKIMQRVSNLTAAVISTPDEHQQSRVWRALGLDNLYRGVRYTPEVQAALQGVLETGEHRLFRLENPEDDADTLVGLCLPLRIKNRTIGLLEVYGPEALLEEDTVEILGSMTSQAASALENARLYGELAERERRLQDLIGKLLMAQEEERRRVAYEVHDSVAQVASAAHQHLQTFVRRYPPASEKSSNELERVMRLVRQTVREARQVIAALRPAVLDDFGLSVALYQEIEELRGDGWQVDYDEKLGEERLPTAVEITLFRVAQEALTNARKHAQTHRARVEIRRQNGTVNLEVRDWGQGFDLKALQGGEGPGERIGLSGMRERVAMLSGEFELSSRPGEGTSVRAWVPLPDALEED